MIAVGAALLIVLAGVLCRTDVYGAFLRGAQQGMETAKSVLPALIGLLSSQSKAEEEKKAASEEKSSEAADVNAAYFTPVKDIIPEDVSESLSEYLH